ncbi:4-(cytidine 5'-diphospho)-2-C-methyl-D-erythritol kinase [Yinghuangia seranimata]|uniref:4-(cytidine 5'-diphospho)-2-C-methyl-D-erythritol kinase n=1 Tax=Yinghuangia seranimata TaxID=408067 RepID=UPI00248AA724|nr:4-(cytidine 5'-diphospho)-2-C-methyl-D-erythritol kinase [Yinghuangia seranimata]MDI2128785.1 4-(cytidine 5'-diphospho)-2-C-methyl-D-erythritol kinase [Yinghuangia seranimata]
MTSVTVLVPAKVNLQLAVGAVRPDGYHELVSVFHAVSLFDEVTVRPADRLTVTVEGEGEGVVPLDRSNLAVRAVELLADRLGQRPDVHVHLRKGIPVAGGMAGGSADAAAALLACDTLWRGATPREMLRRLGAELGSDVPFSDLGGTAIGTGRGERLAAVPSVGRFHWVFALADGGLSTPAVYGECDRLREVAGEPVPVPAPREELVAALRAGDAAALGAAMSNDLQPAALSLRPALRDTLDAGRAAGALGALVSGSGPTCAFLAADEAAAKTVAVALEESGTCRTTRVAYGPVGGAKVVPTPRLRTNESTPGVG